MIFFMKTWSNNHAQNKIRDTFFDLKQEMLKLYFAKCASKDSMATSHQGMDLPNHHHKTENAPGNF